MAKQKVALECLSYHATASQDQTMKLANEPIRSAEEYKLYSFKFIGKFYWNLLCLRILQWTFFSSFLIRLWAGGGRNVSCDDKDVCWFQSNVTVPYTLRCKLSFKAVLTIFWFSDFIESPPAAFN